MNSPPRSSLGGFVIHRSNRATLGDCVRSLLEVCDEVVCVDTGSEDGSGELARELGARVVRVPWEGYGAARARAAAALSRHDYLFFLDSDEHLSEEARRCAQSWRASRPSLPIYTAVVRNWASLEGRPPFLYGRTTRARFVRPEHAAWNPGMIVHEALPSGPPRRPSGVTVEHRFATRVERRLEKERRYALLWAIQAAATGRRLKPAGLSAASQLARHLLVNGSLWRGGADAVALARTAAAYQRMKYTLLRDLRAGAHPGLIDTYRRGDWGRLFSEVDRLGEGGSVTPP